MIKKFTGLFIVLLFLLPLSGFGQKKSIEDQTVSPSNSSIEIEKLEQQVERLNKALDNTIKANDKNRENLSRQLKEAEERLKTAQSDRDLEQKKAAEEREKIEKARHEASLRTFRNGVIVIIVFVIALGIFLSLNHKKTPPVPLIVTSPNSTTEKNKENELGIPLDPDRPTLETYSKDHGGLQEITFILTLTGDRKFLCTAYLQPDGKDPLVRIGEDTQKTEWKKRKRRAEELPQFMMNPTLT